MCILKYAVVTPKIDPGHAKPESAVTKLEKNPWMSANFPANVRLMQSLLSRCHQPKYKTSRCKPPHTTIITGFSISALNAPISSAPSAPSTAR